METLKENSDFLRHPLMSELVSETTNINEEAGQLMKFHGSYQQDDREKRTMGQGKFYQFMMRTKQPAGCVSNQLYLTMDDLANEVIALFCPIKNSPSIRHSCAAVTSAGSANYCEERKFSLPLFQIKMVTLLSPARVKSCKHIVEDSCHAFCKRISCIVLLE